MCTRAVYHGLNNLIITGRSMDWKEDLRSNIYVFPRGIQRSGADNGPTIEWKAKYGSVIAAGYDIGTADGMNEAGLVANLLYLTESEYTRPNDTRPVMGISIWTQYVLDNFATVSEAVQELKKKRFAFMLRKCLTENYQHYTLPSPTLQVMLLSLNTSKENS